MSDEVIITLIGAVASVCIALVPPLFQVLKFSPGDAALRADKVVASRPVGLPPPLP